MNQPIDPAVVDFLSQPEAAASGAADGAADGLPMLGHRFADLDPAFFSACASTPVSTPYPIAISTPVAEMLGFDARDLSSAIWTEAFAGNRVWPESKTVAAVYSGHQFGVWAGQLGDGRALLLGDLPAAGGRLELQLKGSGPTPYSRMGDGRAVLRSSIREFLCSEAMAALGIATTRALALVGSDMPVLRETVESAALVTRVAPSFIRFGSFEHWASKKDDRRLKELADAVIDVGYPELADSPNRYLALLTEVIARSARLVASWQAVGFCHGVLNTDNMSMLGLTLDYGPFGFLEAFDAGYICNHSDHQGRYAFAAQPQVVHWNLYCLARAMLPLMGEVSSVEAALAGYGAVFDQALLDLMKGKLGLAEAGQNDGALFDGLFELLQANHFDYTLFFRNLAQIGRSDTRSDQLILDHALDLEQTRGWLASYRARLAQEVRDDAARKLAMEQVNPKYVLRNYLAELAIKAAEQRDYSVLDRLMKVLSRPFDEQPEAEDLAALPPDWAQGLEVSCSS